MTYSSSLSAGRQHYAVRGQNAVSFRATERTLGPISNTVILIVLACLLGLLYLTQVTKTNAFGYQISDLKDKHSQLQTEHDELQVASARLQSLDRVEKSAVATAMVPTSPSETL